MGHAQCRGSGPLIAKSEDANVRAVGEADGFLHCEGTSNLSMEPANMRMAASLETARRAALRLGTHLPGSARLSA